MVGCPLPGILQCFSLRVTSAVGEAPDGFLPASAGFLLSPQGWDISRQVRSGGLWGEKKLSKMQLSFSKFSDGQRVKTALIEIHSPGAGSGSWSPGLGGLISFDSPGNLDSDANAQRRV